MIAIISPHSPAMQGTAQRRTRMIDKDDGGPACAWCDKPSHIKQGRIFLCAAHYRMSSMRARAKRDGKYVPSLGVLETLAENMKCDGCGEEMHWLRSDGARLQATLQHDRDGLVRLLCLSCNTRHAQHPGDTFYNVPDGHKLCQGCKEVLPHASFWKDRSRPIGLKSYCKSCAADRYRKWEKSHVAA